MKKLDHLMDEFDHRVDRRFGRVFKYLLKHFTAVSSVILGIFLCMFIIKMLYQKPYYISSVIHSDLESIAKILHGINQDCTIMSIRGERVPINFLTVQKFVGSVVGSMQLAHPEKWKGPYLKINPTLQRRCYEIVQASDGVFIVPGVGVKLPNGYTVGKDFQITPQTVVREMTQPGGFLHHRKAALAVALDCKLGSWTAGMEQETSDRSQFEYLLDEFNQALPFSKNEPTTRQA